MGILRDVMSKYTMPSRFIPRRVCDFCERNAFDNFIHEGKVICSKCADEKGIKEIRD